MSFAAMCNLGRSVESIATNRRKDVCKLGIRLIDLIKDQVDGLNIPDGRRMRYILARAFGWNMAHLTVLFAMHYDAQHAKSTLYFVYPLEHAWYRCRASRACRGLFSIYC